MDLIQRDPTQSGQIQCDATDRLLVFAPHPDDESLACGGVIQRAERAGAQVHVVIATNGDANPWPQRLIEKRLRLGADAARRWGAVRSTEAVAALKALGVSADRASFLQWADQGLTTRLMQHGNDSIAQLRQLIATHRPTLVTMPSVLDSHPDHSALAIMLKAALRAEDSPARAMSYWLHGRNGRNGANGDVAHVSLTAEELAGKRAAALSHVSQTRFGTSRLLRFVASIEGFLQPSAAVPQLQPRWRWQFHARGAFGVAAARRIRIVAMTAHGDLHAVTLELRDARRNGQLQTTRRDARTLQVQMAALWQGPLWVVAKLDTSHRINVYDEFAWTQCDRIDVPAPRDAPDPITAIIREESLVQDVAGADTTSLRVTVR